MSDVTTQAEYDEEIRQREAAELEVVLARHATLTTPGKAEWTAATDELFEALGEGYGITRDHAKGLAFRALTAAGRAAETGAGSKAAGPPPMTDKAGRNSDRIEHPCKICQKPSRSCGHTKTDLRAYHDRARELRRAARQDLVPKARRGHKVPTHGPGVFREQDDDGAHQIVMIPVAGKLLKARTTMPKHMVRILTADEYGGGSQGRADGAG